MVSSPKPRSYLQILIVEKLDFTEEKCEQQKTPKLAARGWQGNGRGPRQLCGCQLYLVELYNTDPRLCTGCCTLLQCKFRNNPLFAWYNNGEENGGQC